LFNINHNLLCALGVSHPSLDTIVAEANKAGFPSKLTGAGGGGCALILSPVPYSDVNEDGSSAMDSDSNKVQKQHQLRELIIKIK